MHRTMDTPQYFFNFDLEQTNKAPIVKETSKPLSHAGVFGPVKLFATPLGKGQFYLRLENIADLYDKDTKVEFVDVKLVIYNFWSSSNPGLPFVASDWAIEETSLTGN